MNVEAKQELQFIQNGLMQKQKFVGIALETHQKHLDWWQKYHTSQQTHSQATHRLQQANTALSQAFEPLTRLANSEPAEQLRLPWNRLTESKDRLDKLINELALKNKDESRLNLQLSDATKQLKVADTQLNEVKGTAFNQEQLITEKVLPLDNQIELIGGKNNDKMDAVTGLTQQLKTLQSQKTDIEQQSIAIKEQLTRAEEYLYAHQNDADIAAHINGWIQQLSQIEKETINQETLKKEITELKLALTSASQQQDGLRQKIIVETERLSVEQRLFTEKESQWKALNEQADVNTLEGRQQQITRKWPDFHGAKAIQQKYLQLVKDNTAFLQESGGLKEQEKALSNKRNQLAEQYTTQKQQEADLRKLISQEEQLAHYRARLQDGDECPLCGAIEHPKAADLTVDIPDTQARADAAKKQLELTQEEGTKTKDLLTSTTSRIQDLQKRIEASEQIQQNLQLEWNEIIQKLGNAMQAEVINIEDESGLNAVEVHLKSEGEKLVANISTLRQLEKGRQQAKETVDVVRQGIDKLDAEFKLLNQNQTNQQKYIEDKEFQLKNITSTVNQDEAVLRESIIASGHTPPKEGPKEALKDWLVSKKEDVQQYQIKSQNKQALAQDASVTATKLASTEEQETRLKSDLDSATTDKQALQNQLEDLIQQRKAVFGEKQVAEARQELAKQVEQVESQFNSYTQIHKQVERAHLNVASEIKVLQQNQQQALSLSQQSGEDWDHRLAQSPFASKQEFEAALVLPEERTTLVELKRSLDTELERSKALWEQAELQIAEVQKAENAEKWQQIPKEDVEANLRQLQDQQEQVITQNAQVKQKLQDDKEETERQKDLFREIEHQQQEYDDLSYLHSLIGSASGDKFRRFAQGLTLDNLVYLANKQLERLHGRYLLKRKDKEGLALSVLDTWQGEMERNTKTLSGGESFLVSLALALALSDLVSHKTSIDSLFLDEGFGTLDAETLDIALDALDNLNATGKTIGVISHIEAMKERIPTQLRVIKKSGLGISELDKQFCV